MATRAYRLKLVVPRDGSAEAIAKREAFALPRGLVRDLSPVVSVLPGVVSPGRHGSPMSSPIAVQFISDQPFGNVAQPLQALAKEPVGRSCIPRFCTRISSMFPS